MNKKDLIRAVAAEIGETQGKVSQVLDSALELIKKELCQGNEVALHEFGSFKPKHAPARPGRNPQTGENLTIQAKNSCKFQQAKAFVDLMN